MTARSNMVYEELGRELEGKLGEKMYELLAKLV